MKKRFFISLITVFLAAWFLPALTFGGGGVVQLDYVGAGVTFTIYEIGEYTAEGFYVDDDFDDYGVDLESSNAAQTLAVYIERDDIQADDTAVTGSDGTAVFSGLESGYYLILGETYTDGNSTYTALPVMLTVYDNQEYDVTGKYEVKTTSDEDDSCSVSALKVWSGGSLDSITVQLLCDGQIYDEQVLTSSCNWRYTWSNLSTDHNWQVAEKEVPSGYSVSVEKDGSVFILLNTKDEDSPGGGSEPEPTTEASTEAVTEKPVETTTKKTSGGGGGGSVVVNTTEATTEAAAEEPTETTTENKSENETEAEAEQETETYKDNTGEYETGDNSGSDSGDNGDSDGSVLGIDSSSIGDDSSTFGINQEVINSSDEIGGGVLGAEDEGEEGGAGLLPQTGQLWYPVPILSCLGMLLIIIGIGRRRMS